MADVITSAPALPENPSIADLRAHLMPEKTPAPEPVKAAPEASEAKPTAGAEADKPAEAEPKSGESTDKPVEAQTDQSTETEEKQEQKEQPRDKEGKFAKREDLPEGVQKALNRETARAREARREAEKLLEEVKQLHAAAKQGTDPAKKPDVPAEAKTAEGMPEPPDQSKFDTYEDFRKAETKYHRELTQWEVAQALKTRDAEEAKRRQQEKRQEAAKTWEQRAKQFANDPDFEEAVEVIGPALTKAGVSDLVMQSEVGPQMLKYLYENQEEATKIAALGSPLLIASALGKIEAKLQTPPAPAKAAPKQEVPKAALKPPRELGGGNQPAPVDLEKCDMRTFAREMQNIGIRVPGR